VRMFTELLQVIHLPRCSADEWGMRYAAPRAQPVFPWSEAPPLFPIVTDAPRPRRRRSPTVALVPQPASSTLRPLRSSVHVHRTGSELRMRLPSPSSPTYIRPSSATRFQNSLVSSHSPSFIDRSPGSGAYFRRGWKQDGAPGQLRLTLQQVLEIGERPIGIRWLVFPARRHLRRRVSDLLPRVLIIVTVET
jgi:hypothetical protein